MLFYDKSSERGGAVAEVFKAQPKWEIIKRIAGSHLKCSGLRCGSISAKQMGGYSDGCTFIGGPIRGLERGL